jgi:uncharacterized membrane protein YagU involved in acid resistance
MSSEPRALPQHESEVDPDSVHLPRPTVAPLVLSLGMALIAAGVATGPAFLVVGAVVLACGLASWVGELLPGRGHVAEPLVAPSLRAKPVRSVPGAVRRLEEGMPGYRMRLPATVHPISAGLKGGIVGGLVMPLPALAYGLLSGHGPWYPVNLLAGMGIPGVDGLTVAELEQFRPTLLVVATVIHAINSVIFGVIYGVLLPTLPAIPRPIAWAGLLMPLIWTAVSYGLMKVVNPLMNQRVDWPWFIASQFCFGVTAAALVLRSRWLPPVVAGLLGGLGGGLLMPVPALLWGLVSGRGIWYPLNLLAAMVIPGIGRSSAESLARFHAEWFGAAVAIHVGLSLGSGLVFGLLSPRLRPIPAALSWGGVLIPLLWTAWSYSLMGVVNPILQHRVDWPWFIVSQFVFGVVAATVVLRSEMIYIPPAGRGPDSVAEFVAGSDGGES